MMNKIVILGGAESGVGAAVLAKKQGFDVFVSDMGLIKEKYKNLLNEHDIEWKKASTLKKRYSMPRRLSRALVYPIQLLSWQRQ
jgi:UDP-N-acetylmuramoylalanine-D-glutamate ligase